MSLTFLVPWPANTELAWPLTLRLGARPSQPVELYGPNLFGCTLARARPKLNALLTFHLHCPPHAE